MMSDVYNQLYRFRDRNRSILWKKTFTTSFSATGSNVSFLI